MYHHTLFGCGRQCEAAKHRKTVFFLKKNNQEDLYYRARTAATRPEPGRKGLLVLFFRKEHAFFS